MDDRALMIVLRILHILAGLLWVGSLSLLTMFLMPAVRDSGPAGGRVMAELMGKRKLATWLSSAGGLTILSGLLMMWRLDRVTHHAWIQTSSGKVLLAGAIAALIAGFTGGGIAGPANQKLAQLGAAAAAGGGPPSPAQQAEMERLRSRGVLGSRLTVGFLLAAAVAMAVARYT